MEIVNKTNLLKILYGGYWPLKELSIKNKFTVI